MNDVVPSLRSLVSLVSFSSPPLPKPSPFLYL
jgi:hypothetical protein